MAVELTLSDILGQRNVNQLLTDACFFELCLSHGTLHMLCLVVL